jgi:hypothetical protein
VLAGWVCAGGGAFGLCVCVCGAVQKECVTAWYRLTNKAATEGGAANAMHSYVSEYVCVGWMVDGSVWVVFE